MCVRALKRHVLSELKYSFICNKSVFLPLFYSPLKKIWIEIALRASLSRTSCSEHGFEIDYTVVVECQLSVNK